MSTAQYRRGMLGVIALFIALASLGNHAYANRFDDKDFSLRFPAALSRVSSYADVAATGGASAGSKWQSSVNPASIAWQSMPGVARAKRGVVCSLLYKDLDNFKEVNDTVGHAAEDEGLIILKNAKCREMK